MKRAAEFFEYARKRQRIYLDRKAGLPEPWTDDYVLRRWRFCNVFREDDRVTRWFRERVREPMRYRPEALLATVVFRLFNRIETGRAIFCDDDLLDESSAFFDFVRTGKTDAMRRRIIARIGDRGPYVTGSYIINTPRGFDKLNGVLSVLRQFYETPQPVDDSLAGNKLTMNWRSMTQHILGPYGQRGGIRLETAWRWFLQFDYIGEFTAYEIVTDLRHTSLLERAPDVDTWANPGPGARRGFNRVTGRKYNDKEISRERLILGMRELLLLSRDAKMWPADWPRWELREVEHTLCEFDKYERARTGVGKPKRIFR